ncbi:hypothetical protein EI94DRAFT_1449603, partial [Lactarius quietus]
RNRPGPLKVQTTLINSRAPTSRSTPATARYIEDINRITYPEGIKRPKIELNVNAQRRRFRYDRDFLLQFMTICKGKPEILPILDAIGI